MENTMQNFGLKELTQVSLKANETMRFGDRIIAKDEPITYFDNMQISALTEITKGNYAKGGRGSLPLVAWESRQNVEFRVVAGVLSPIGLALLVSANVVVNAEPIAVPYNEVVLLGSTGRAFLKHTPTTTKPIFSYRYENELIQGNSIPYVSLDNKEIVFDEQYAGKQICVDYSFIYDKNSTRYTLERERFNSGFCRIEGKIEMKGEYGETSTGLLTIPKIKIESNLNLRLGGNADPAVSIFKMVAFPTKVSNISDYTIVEIVQLEDDIR